MHWRVQDSAKANLQERKPMAAILELYFRFASWSPISLWRNVIYNPTQFRRYESIQAEVISIYRKSDTVSAAILDFEYSVITPPTKLELGMF